MVVNTLELMGYDTIASRGGSEALDVVRSGEKIDLLFTDLIMPGGIDGAKLAHEARRVRPGLPVLLTTGFAAAGADASFLVDDDMHVLRTPYRQPDSPGCCTTS